MRQLHLHCCSCRVHFDTSRTDMASREDLMENIGESFGYVNIMVDRKVEQLKLSVAEKSATTISGLLTTVILVVLGILVIIFGLIALAFLIAGGDNTAIAAGFGIVGLGMLILLIIIFLLRRQLIVNPTVAKVISIFFDEQSKS